jgi:acetyl esterase/lipase
VKSFTRTVGSNGARLTAFLNDAVPGSPAIPAVVVFPGGGYMNVSEGEADPVALAYHAEGFHSFVLRYSVGMDATFAEALEDAEAALAEIRAHAKDWGVAPHRVAVIGFSAGGHLAASLGTIGVNRPNALLLGYAITLDITLSAKPPYPAVVPHVDGDNPPTFLFSTGKDQVVPVAHTLAFAAALAGAHVDFEVHVFQEGLHGLGLAPPRAADVPARRAEQAFAQWFGLSLRWLRALWGLTPADVGDCGGPVRPPARSV